MQVDKEIFHELHFVLDKGLQHTLHELMQEADKRSLTKFLSGVLKLLYPWLEHEHFFGKERQARYKLVNADPGVPRLHVHVELPYSLCKRIKLMYQDLNFFSIDQLMRWVLGEFVKLTKQYGKGVREAMSLSLAILRYINSFFQKIVKDSTRVRDSSDEAPCAFPEWGVPLGELQHEVPEAFDRSSQRDTHP